VFCNEIGNLTDFIGRNVGFSWFLANVVDFGQIVDLNPSVIALKLDYIIRAYFILPKLFEARDKKFYRLNRSALAIV
jgi:ferredoxin-fold anticodon binding domain-containing protein